MLHPIQYSIIPDVDGQTVALKHGAKRPHRDIERVSVLRSRQQTGMEMTQENTDQIGQAETDFEQGYDDRWRDIPYRDDASEAWQRGWKETNLELSGDDSIEF